MNRMDQQGGRSEYEYSGSELEEEYQMGKENAILDDWDRLYKARDQLATFVQQIQIQNCGGLRKDIIAHCGSRFKKQKMPFFSADFSQILGSVNIRIQKMIKNKRLKRNWSQEDVKLLIWVISKYCDKMKYKNAKQQLIEADWKAISSMIPGTTPQSCMFKWLSLKKISLSTHNWTQQESQLLKQIVQQNTYYRKDKQTRNWKKISQILFDQNQSHQKIYRNAKQCREHWNCYLNPNLKKGPWTPEEDIRLMKLIQERGRKKWAQIVKHFDGRTENALKNRFLLIMEKQRRANKIKNEAFLIRDYMEKLYLHEIIPEKNHKEAEKQDSCIFQEEYAEEQEKQQPQRIFIQQQKEEEKIISEPEIEKLVPVQVKKFDAENLIDFNADSIKLGILDKQGNFMGVPFNQPEWKTECLFNIDLQKSIPF